MIRPAAFLFQKLLVILSYWVIRAITPGRRRGSISWVVGPRETAGVVHAMAARIPASYSVALKTDPYYSHRYDTTWLPVGQRRERLRTLFVSPILLGWLATRARGFIYVGSSGFLLEAQDDRRFEFAFLKRRRIKIACYWCGSDIRSPRLMHELEHEMSLPNISTYMDLVVPSFATEEFEQRVRSRAAIADEFADVMFTFPTAQRSYLTRWAEPAFYFMEDDSFTLPAAKFMNLSPVLVVHAASEPVIKGTQLVRAAVGQLKAEGYRFDYVEYIGVPNDEVLAGLRRAHVVLNHFYGFTTGMFALEAMAAGCAVLSSTDETIETMLPPGANAAVMVTKHYAIYDNLRKLLDEPELIEPLARRGHEWALRHTARSHAGLVLTTVLDSVLDGSYDPIRRSTLPIAALWNVDVVHSE